MQLLDGGARVDDIALGARVGQNGTDKVFANDAIADIGNLDLELDGASTLGSYGQYLRVKPGIEQNAASLLYRAGHQPHGLGGGRGFVEKRGVRDGQTGEGLNHGLEIQQCLEAALRDLRLVGRVGGVPAGILEQAAADHRRCEGIGVALAVERLQHDVLGGILAQLRLRVILAQSLREVQRFGGADGGGQGGIDECFHAVIAHCLEHRLTLGRIGPEVARDEIHVSYLLCGVSLCDLNCPQV